MRSMQGEMDEMQSLVDINGKSGRRIVIQEQFVSRSCFRGVVTA
jgi:hypothetical protein